jgi:hypothetical protein
MRDPKKKGYHPAGYRMLKEDISFNIRLQPDGSLYRRCDPYLSWVIKKERITYHYFTNIWVPLISDVRYSCCAPTSIIDAGYHFLYVAILECTGKKEEYAKSVVRKVACFIGDRPEEFFGVKSDPKPYTSITSRNQRYCDVDIITCN